MGDFTLFTSKKDENVTRITFYNFKLKPGFIVNLTSKNISLTISFNWNTSGVFISQVSSNNFSITENPKLFWNEKAETGIDYKFFEISQFEIFINTSLLSSNMIITFFHGDNLFRKTVTGDVKNFLSGKQYFLTI